MPERWDFAVEVVIIGAGATGLPAAIRARDAGAPVLVVEANYDVGGHAIVSGGNVPLGGGTSAQRHYGIHNSPDIVFADLTDWSIGQSNGWPAYRYNDHALMRAFADASAPTIITCMRLWRCTPRRHRPTMRRDPSGPSSMPTRWPGISDASPHPT